MTKARTLADAARLATEPKTATPVAPSRRGKKAMVLYVDPELSKRLKVLAAQNDTSVHALGLEALDLVLDRYEGLRMARST